MWIGGINWGKWANPLPSMVTQHYRFYNFLNQGFADGLSSRQNGAHILAAMDKLEERIRVVQ
jgi:hypothetical protein